MVRLAVAMAVIALSSEVIAMPRSFAVRSAQVEHDGQWHPDPNGQQTRQQCAGFKLSDAAALRWFARSKEVSEHDWFERLDWTQCSADGKLVTGDGHSYSWELDQSGRGRIIISSSVSVYLSGSELPRSR